MGLPEKNLFQKIIQDSKTNENNNKKSFSVDIFIAFSDKFKNQIQIL